LWQDCGNYDKVTVGGEGHKTDHGDSFKKHYDNLEEFAKSIFNVNDVLYR
jgi:ABC-type transporter lipoprotein component MlaA